MFLDSASCSNPAACACIYVHVCTQDNLRCCSPGLSGSMVVCVLRFECLSGIGPCLGAGLNLEITRTDRLKHLNESLREVTQ